MDLKYGKINLSRFKSSSIEEINGKRGVFIPLEENHLEENFKKEVYIDLVSFPVKHLKPFSHNILLSVPESFRKNVDKDFWLLGGYKLK